MKDDSMTIELPNESQKNLSERISKKIHDDNMKSLSEKVAQRTAGHLRIKNPTRSYHGLLNVKIDKRLRKTIFLWTLKKLLGKPKICRLCGHTATQEHIAKCGGVLASDLENIMITRDVEKHRYLPEMIITRMETSGRMNKEILSQVGNSIRKVVSVCTEAQLDQVSTMSINNDYDIKVYD